MGKNRKGKGGGGGGAGGGDGNQQQPPQPQAPQTPQTPSPTDADGWVTQPPKGRGQGGQGGQGGQPQQGQGRGQGGQPQQGQAWGQGGQPQQGQGRGQGGQPQQGQAWGQGGQPQQGQGRGRGGQPQQGQGRGQGGQPQQGQAWGQGGQPQQGQGRGRGGQPGRGRGGPQAQAPGQGHPPGAPQGGAWGQQRPGGAQQFAPAPTPSPTPIPTPAPSHSPSPSQSPAPQQASQPQRASQPQQVGQASSAKQSPSRGPPGKQIALPLRANCPPEKKFGKPIPLEVNHLLVQFDQRRTDPIYHYDVTIDPDKPKRFMRPVMEEVKRLYYPKNHPGFDGRKNLYSRGPLPIDEQATKIVNVVDEERDDKKPKTFNVTIKKVRSNISLKDLFAYQLGSSSTTPQDVIQAIDVVLRSAAARRFVQVGRSFFWQSPGGREYDLGSGMECYLGYFQSFVMGRQPYLNLDVAHKGFPKAQYLIDMLAEFDFRARSPEEVMQRYERDIERHLKGLKVEYEIPGVESSKRTYRVNGFRRDALKERFQTKDGKTFTIGEYFAKEKRYNLKYPYLPVLHVGAREKEILVPMELCKLAKAQVTQKKLDEGQTSAMIKLAATSVEKRKDKIKMAMAQAKLNASPEVQEFGLSVANEFAKVEGRILQPPKLDYKQQQVQPFKGVWRGGQFLQSRPLKKWICVCFAGYVKRDELSSFMNNLVKEANTLQMMMSDPDPPIMIERSRNPKGDLAQILPDLKKKGYELVLIVLDGRNKQLYGQVKQSAEINVGILTQCVKDNTVQRRNNQATVHNIMLKINAKFNGTNQKIANASQVKCMGNNSKVLIFGADVTHPSPDSKDIPSVAAVTASHDIFGFKYNVKIRLQPPRQEMIDDLENIVFDQLNIYKQETGALPQHIIFYRDGVSEGQFQQVLEIELTALRQACARAACRPKVTFLVVQKRHHTRFFPTNPRFSEDRNGNVPAGTIVDTEICHPTEIDFYLVSHASIQGVARPTKYHVLCDEANMSENEIHYLTYNLCHLFTRCDRAVSYPAPTYYAHLAASRGRVYLEGHNIKLEDLKRESKKIETAMNFTNMSPMYFV
ncbi:hypothetical protein ONE63_010740 [Megalurothrips usitatus]|uniref:Protein argonaute-2-like n=1 Tax=Megalurothrips usitatus TaxID=439358 RepID=A0AAV7XI33_9NEOP|nr:hypothetical protein ONE63_010740 [Megalurothrips usitatus]